MPTKENNHVIYCYTNDINGKQYVGQTKHSKERHKQHQASENQSTPFSRAIKKYGLDSFDYEILYDNLTQDEANDLEIKTISELDCIVPFGYNVLEGGNCRALTGDSKKKHYDKCSLRKKKYRVIFPDGTIEIVTGLREFCMKHGLKSSAMANVANKKLEHSQGFICEHFIEGKPDNEYITQDDVFGNNSVKGCILDGIYYRGKAYIITPPSTGIPVIVTTLKDFCSEYGIGLCNMTNKANGRDNAYCKGYLCEFYSKDRADELGAVVYQYQS